MTIGRPDIARYAEETVTALKDLEGRVESCKQNVAAVCATIGQVDTARVALAPHPNVIASQAQAAALSAPGQMGILPGAQFPGHLGSIGSFGNLAQQFPAAYGATAPQWGQAYPQIAGNPYTVSGFATNPGYAASYGANPAYASVFGGNPWAAVAPFGANPWATAPTPFVPSIASPYAWAPLEAIAAQARTTPFGASPYTFAGPQVYPGAVGSPFAGVTPLVR